MGALHLNKELPSVVIEFVYGFLNMQSACALNAGIQRSFLQQRATLRLNATDLFRKNIRCGASDFTDYTQVFTNTSDTRQVALDLTWRFGNKAVPAMRRRKGGAEDEKRRTTT